MEKENSVQVQVTLELGHTASCRKKKTVEGFTHDWKVFVRGPANCDVSHFVEKVQFQLHESFTKPKRVIKDPPYFVEQSGYGGFVLPVDIYFKNKEDPKKVQFNYDLFLPAVGLAPINNIRSEALTFTNPTEEFKRKLLKGGGTIVPSSSSSLNGFHSTPNPENTTGEFGGKRPGGVTEDQITSSTLETDKVKKPRTEKSDVIKNSKNQERADENRPANLTNTTPTSTVKKKKKVGEVNAVKCKPVGFIPLELPTAENELKEKIEEVSDAKLKIKSLTPKSNGERKKEMNTSSELSSTATNAKKRKSSLSEVKGKKKAKGVAKQLKDDKLTEKVKLRRSSNDSSTSSSSSLVIGNIGSKSKNLALGALLKEMEVESDEDDDEQLDMLTPFQSNSTPQSEAKGYVNGVKSPTNSSCKKNSKTVTKVSKGDSKSNGHLKREDMLSSANGKLNGNCLNDLAKPDALSPSLKQSALSRLKEGKASYKDESSVPELIHLHKRLMSIRDATRLQRIVDILEATGAYSISDATFDFDLCALDKPTIKKIESCLDR